MTPYFPLIQWLVDAGVLAFVGIAKWGMRQREKAHASETKAVLDRVVALEQSKKETEDKMAKHQADINDVRARTEQVEGYMKRVTEDFATALRQMEKMSERIDAIKDNMLRRQDLDLIAKINQG